MTPAVAVQTERRMGRRTNEEVEASTPTGRALHWLEDRLAQIDKAVAVILDHHDRETLLDADCDARVRAAIAQLDAGNGFAARALLLEFVEHDAIRDAAHRAQRPPVTTINAVKRRVWRWVEQQCLRLRRGTP